MTKLSDAVNASNLDSYELARRSNVSEKRLNGYLSGRHSFSRAPLEDAVAIANALGGRIEDYRKMRRRTARRKNWMTDFVSNYFWIALTNTS